MQHHYHHYGHGWCPHDNRNFYNPQCYCSNPNCPHCRGPDTASEQNSERVPQPDELSEELEEAKRVIERLSAQVKALEQAKKK